MDDENNDSDTEYTESSTQNWLQQFMSSLAGVVIGICLFIGSFVLLFHNEGRIDFSQAAKSAIVIPADTPSSQAQGKIVSLTGDITTPGTIGDGLYIRPGAYVALSRTVEMYAWEEKESKQESKQLGGSKTTTTTYRYNKIWTNRPPESIKFKQSSSHRNPAKALKDQVFKPPLRRSVPMASIWLSWSIRSVKFTVAMRTSSHPASIVISDNSWRWNQRCCWREKMPLDPN
jgi:Transmembrane protein 43